MTTVRAPGITAPETHFPGQGEADPNRDVSVGIRAVGLGFRMDFVLLLPLGQRIVLEVDGSQHFTSPDGRPDAARYAANMRGDRDLKLSGYEVFRFGATELHRRDPARVLLQQFFSDLFLRFTATPHAA